MSRCIEPQDGSAGLAPHAHRFTFRGAPAELSFPNLCPNCGQTPSATILCSKVFRRTDSESGATYVVSSVEVPFCAACIARHHGQSTPSTPFYKLLSSFSTAEMLGAVFPGIACMFVVWLALKDLFRGRFLSFALLLVVAAFFGAIAWFQRLHVWQQTEHLRVAPQTDVSRSFDFGDHDAPAFESARFTCTVCDGRFAEALHRLNRSREWVVGSPEVRAEMRHANRKLWIVGGLIALFVLLSWIVS